MVFSLDKISKKRKENGETAIMAPSWITDPTQQRTLDMTANINISTDQSQAMAAANQQNVIEYTPEEKKAKPEYVGYFGNEKKKGKKKLDIRHCGI